jgi:hypothetical protein
MSQLPRQLLSLSGVHHWRFVARFEIFPPIHTLYPDSNNCLLLHLHSSVDFRRFHTLRPQKTNNASLLFHGASWQWSGHVVRTTAQAHTPRSSRPLYGILLRSHFVSRNKIFRCAFYSMHFRITFPLFNDFSSFIVLWVYISFGKFNVALFHICQDRHCFGQGSHRAQTGSCFRKFYFFFQLGNDVIFEIVISISFSTHCPFRYVWW